MTVDVVDDELIGLHKLDYRASIFQAAAELREGVCEDLTSPRDQEASVPEVLDRIRQEMSARLGELRPLVDEQARLEAALQALSDVRGRTPVPASPVRAGQRKLRAAKATPAGARERAPRGANRVVVLEAAENRPGATSAELAAASGVQRNTLNALLARLARAASCGQRRFRPAEPDTCSHARSRKRQQAHQLPPAAMRRRPRATTAGTGPGP
jgi:hypothetical protein